VQEPSFNVSAPRYDGSVKYSNNTKHSSNPPTRNNQSSPAKHSSSPPTPSNQSFPAVSEAQTNREHNKSLSKNAAGQKTLPVEQSLKDLIFSDSKSPLHLWYPAPITVDGIHFHCAGQFVIYRAASKFFLHLITIWSHWCRFHLRFNK
jgi:hypothetical protein